MKSLAGTLAAPFPWFGGKSLACTEVWAALGDPENYVEPFAGSAAMLLGREEAGKVETINDADGFVANFWRAVSLDAEAVARHVDWPCNEADLFARHSWLVRQRQSLLDSLHSDPNWHDAKIAGWWCWGLCNWIGSGWCSGTGPWIHDGERLVDSRKLPHLGNAGQGVNRKLPHLGDAGQGRSAYIHEWFAALQDRMRNVRVACGDWSRVLKDSVTLGPASPVGVLLDPPYADGDAQYAAGGTGTTLSADVRAWAIEHGDDPRFRIVLCGYEGEHAMPRGWRCKEWKALGGYGNAAGNENARRERLWLSPFCVEQPPKQRSLFEEVSR